MNLDLVLITGMSGSGKSVALHALEDAGYYCVDNLPPELLTSFIALQHEQQATRVAIAMDVRSGVSLPIVPQQLEAHYAAFPAAFKHWAPESWEGVPSEALTAIEQICHVRDIEIEYGRCDQVSPLIRRVTANNPGPFTFKGTGTKIGIGLIITLLGGAAMAWGALMWPRKSTSIRG